MWKQKKFQILNFVYLCCTHPLGMASEWKQTDFFFLGLKITMNM